jgi:hypothetical protein
MSRVVKPYSCWRAPAARHRVQDGPFGHVGFPADVGMVPARQGFDRSSRPASRTCRSDGHTCTAGCAGTGPRPYSSWISQVERWFAELQRRCLDRGVFCSLGELTTALENWIKIWNTSAQPFTWTKTADQIIDRICRYCSRIYEPAH